MARLQVGIAADDYQWLPDLLDLESLDDVVTTSGTAFVYVNGRGETVTVVGAGFSYAGNKPTGGVISSVTVTDGLAQPLLTIDQLDNSLSDFVNRLLDEDSFTALEGLLSGSDQLLGSDESDTIGGYSPGNDIVQGKGGSDYLIGDPGDDQFIEDAGDSYNTLSYDITFFNPTATKGIVLDVAKGTVRDPWGDTDSFSNIDSFVGTRFGDKLLGSSSGDSEFQGLRGKDLIDGKGGWDLVDYSYDANYDGGGRAIKVDLSKGTVRDGFGDKDTIKGIEAFRGTAGNDVFKGGNKNDEFDGIAGKDKFDGGKGFDFLSFSSNNFKGGLNGVSVNVAQGKVLDDGFGNAETFKHMESFIGTDYGDTFVGSKKADEFKGENGNDTMTGGKGGDTFVFNPPPDSATNHDIITDFNEGEGDRMALWTRDGFPLLNEIDGGLDPAQFVANAGGTPTNAQHRIVYDTLTGNLFLDPDGNASSGDQVLIVTLTNKPQITVEAFEVWV